MTLAAGTKVGPYEIVSPLGAGGMGEVYRARDSRLGRDVALKVLPGEMAGDSQRMARFRREAQVLASLNHSNIAAIYGFEESGSVHALVMELVQGQTLAERFERTEPLTPGPSLQGSGWSREAGPGEGSRISALQIEEGLPIAKQIAEALEYAHDHGIIHRDLKPANIKITPEGTVKVLDFGLAKALDVDPSSVSPASSPTFSPTLSIAATQAGMILGTAAYMSPEQAKGKSVDRRADIWAFGCVLYEMLTGAQTFTGETVTDVLAGVVRAEPDWALVPATVPARVHELLRRCLIKDPKQRLQAIGEARIALEETTARLGAGLEAHPYETGGQTRPLQSAEVRSPIRRALPWAIASILLIVAVISTTEYLRLARAPQRAIVAEIPPPAGAKFLVNGMNAANAELSPDGTRIVFVASGADGRDRLWVRALDSTESRPLEGTGGAMTLFWSPDSRYVGFFAHGKLKKIDIAAGAPVNLCDASWGRGGTWAEDGTILFTPNISSPIERVSAIGGTPVPVTGLDASRAQTNHRWPQFLPDRQHFIFFSNSSNPDYAGTYVSSLQGGEAKFILKGSSNAIYASGHLLYADGGNLMAQAFDLKQLKLVGDPMAIEGKVGIIDVSARALITASAKDLLAYWATDSPAAVIEVDWFDRNGKKVGSAGYPKTIAFSPRLSPDGSRLALQSSHVGGNDIWITDLARNTSTRLTFNPANNTGPVWSSDGKQIAFASNRSGIAQIYVKSANGAGAATQLLKENTNDVPKSWSSDGRYLAFLRADPKPNASQNIWILPLFGDRKPFPFVTNSFIQDDPAFSPDGRWLAYASDDSGRQEIYIAPFPKANGKWQVSAQGGMVPTWRRDGQDLFYLDPEQKMMAVDIHENGDSIEIGSAHVLFQTNPPSLVNRPYDATADGKKFIVLTQSDQTSAVPLTLVTNWPALLRKE